MRIPSYDDELLHLAEDLARRLLPAFDTPTGICSELLFYSYPKFSRSFFSCNFCAFVASVIINGIVYIFYLKSFMFLPGEYLNLITFIITILHDNINEKFSNRTKHPELIKSDWLLEYILARCIYIY